MRQDKESDDLTDLGKYTVKWGWRDGNFVGVAFIVTRSELGKWFCYVIFLSTPPPSICDLGSQWNDMGVRNQRFSRNFQSEECDTIWFCYHATCCQWSTKLHIVTED
jgi:hypothetical protein